MKKIFAIFISILFVASLSLAVVGCKKAETPATPTVKSEIPALHPPATPAPVATTVPAPAPAK
jgi:hypothetical protein